jgi:hypothetical protein
VWGITAETGVRLDHLRKSTLGGLQLHKRRLLLGDVNGPKRQPQVFLTEGAAKHLHETYHPWRERFEHMLGQQTNRLFPAKS